MANIVVVTEQKYTAEVVDNVIQVTTVGIPGPTGPQGPTGTGAGFVWRGDWVPATLYNANESVHYNGDSYVCIAVNTGQVPGGSPNAYWDLYASQGVIGPQGDPGADGVIGNKWYDGSGAPAAGLGDSDDYYLDNVTGDYYKKLGSPAVWTLQGNLQGPQGIQGIQGIQGEQGIQGTIWYTGTGAPAGSPDFGIRYDYYLDEVTGDYYNKIGSPAVWTLQGNIKGVKGDTGDTGIIDGGFANSTYTAEQIINGGGA